MIFTFYKIFIAVLILTCSLQLAAQTSNFKPQTSNLKRYEAIVQGKIISKKVKKIDNYYITEYKLKSKKWIYKKPEVEKRNLITIRILGAELLDKGIVIRPSFAPNYVPINKQAIFLLEKTKRKQKNIYTLSTDGIIFKES